MSYFLKKITELYRKRNISIANMCLSVEPFASDKFCGLGHVAEMSMMFFYTIFSFSFLLFMVFFKEGIEPSWHNYLLLFPFISIAVLSFLIPIIRTRKLIFYAKELYLHCLTNKN